MLYAQAYAARKNCDEPISLSLYSLRRLMLEPVGPYKIRIAPFRPQTESDIALKQMPRSTKWRILDYRDYSPQLNRLLIGHLNELFSDEPFRCTDDISHCRLCRFTSICRTDKDD